MVIVVGRGDVADVHGMVVVNELMEEGSAHHDNIPEMTNDDDVAVRRLVAMLPTARHPPSLSMWPLVRLETWRCHVVLAVVVVGDGCAWPRALVMMVRWASWTMMVVEKE